jgi:Polyketide cyclase / dehydrase and lipid transport
MRIGADIAWHPLERAGAEFFDSAPQKYRFCMEVPRRPDEVWESLTSNESLAAWPMGPGVRFAARWTSPRPLGVGAGREVTLPFGALTLRERFFHWEDARGYSFYVEEASRPGLRRFAENYTLQPAPTGTLLTWLVAIERGRRNPALSLLLNRVAFSRTAAAAKKHLMQR